MRLSARSLQRRHDRQARQQRAAPSLPTPSSLEDAGQNLARAWELSRAHGKTLLERLGITAMVTMPTPPQGLPKEALFLATLVCAFSLIDLELVSEEDVAKALQIEDMARARTGVFELLAEMGGRLSTDTLDPAAREAVARLQAAFGPGASG